MSTPLNEPASFPFSQWLVALIGCEAALPSARATRARAMVDVMLAAVPDTNAERRILIQWDILRSTERCLHSNAFTTGLFPALSSFRPQWSGPDSDRGQARSGLNRTTASGPSGRRSR